MMLGWITQAYISCWSQPPAKPCNAASRLAVTEGQPNEVAVVVSMLEWLNY